MSQRSPAQEAVIRQYMAAKAMSRSALSLNDAAKMAGVSTDTLRMRLRRGKVEGYRDESGHVFIYRDQIGEPQTDGQKEVERQPQHDELLLKIISRLERMERFQETLLQLLNSIINELIAGKRDEREWIDEVSKQKNQPF